MASKRHLRRRACENKRQYDKPSAIQTAKHIRATKREWMNAYQCPYGDHWHLGHPVRGAKVAIRQRMAEMAARDIAESGSREAGT